MTAPARITQADWNRAAKAVAGAGIARARIRADLKNSVIEIILGESGPDPVPPEEWGDDD